jgi:hypothetical protein
LLALAVRARILGMRDPGSVAGFQCIGITHYYYCCAVLFAALDAAPVLWVPYAILVAWWGSLGLVFSYLTPASMAGRVSCL